MPRTSPLEWIVSIIIGIILVASIPVVASFFAQLIGMILTVILVGVVVGIVIVGIIYLISQS